jgi:hypothetical protein
MPANSSLSLFVDQPQLKVGQRMLATLQQTIGGTWMTEDFPAGDYTLTATVAEQRASTNGAISFTVHMRTKVPFTIPTNPPSGVLDLGEIVLQQVQ